MTLLGLLQELHLQVTLSRIPIFTSDKAKQGQKPQVSCCPICAYIVKNDSTFVNHIVISHYWSNFACGKCLNAIATSGQQMKHFLKCCSIADVHKKPDLQGSISDGSLSSSKSSKLHSSGRSSSKSKKDKDNRCGDDKKGNKTHKSKSKESKTDGKAASQDEFQESLHHSSCLARAGTSGGCQEDVGKAPCTHWSHKKFKEVWQELMQEVMSLMLDAWGVRFHLFSQCFVNKVHCALFLLVFVSYELSALCNQCGWGCLSC